MGINDDILERTEPGYDGSYGVGAIRSETEICVMVRIKASNYITIAAFERATEAGAFDAAADALLTEAGKIRRGEREEREL